MVPHLLQLYRTPTPDLLVRLGRVRADWRGGGRRRLLPFWKIGRLPSSLPTHMFGDPERMSQR